MTINSQQKTINRYSESLLIADCLLLIDSWRLYE